MKQCAETMTCPDLDAANMARDGSDDVERIEVAGMDYVVVPARNLRRSVEFYNRVFGYRIIEEARDRDRSSVLMSAGEETYLTVHEQHGASDLRRSRWSFNVRDLDQAREDAWNLGAPTADDSGEHRDSRSFVVRDPDGHEIELVEKRELATLV